jgi:hypothetical protein
MSATYDVKRELLSAFRKLMAPLVRILLRQGVSSREFAEVLKDVFVAEAASELATPERKASLARIAIVTGLTRKEVASIVREEALRRKGRESNANRAARVLEAWHTDPRFVGPYGFPRDLLIEGDDPAGTFEHLVRRYSGDMPVRAMLDELVRVGAARLLDGGLMVQVLARSYIPKDMTPETIQVFTQAVRRYIETVDFNLSRREVGLRRFDRAVYPDPGLREEDVPAFQQEMREYLESVISEIDFRSTSYLRPNSATGEKTVRVGVGLFFYHDEPESTKPLTDLIGRLPASELDVD